MRTVKLALGDAIASKFSPGVEVWQWVVEYCSDTFSRYEVGKGGVTPYKRAKGRESIAAVASFENRFSIS